MYIIEKFASYYIPADLWESQLIIHKYEGVTLNTTQYYANLWTVTQLRLGRILARCHCEGGADVPPWECYDGRRRPGFRSSCVATRIITHFHSDKLLHFHSAKLLLVFETRIITHFHSDKLLHFHSDNLLLVLATGIIIHFHSDNFLQTLKLLILLRKPHLDLIRSQFIGVYFTPPAGSKCRFEIVWKRPHSP